MKTTQFKTLVAVIALCLLLTACTQQSVETQPPETQSTTAPTTEPTETTPVAIETEKYTIYWENGKCYLKSNMVDTGDSEGNSGINATSYSVSYPHFSSISEMKRRLTTGNLSEDEIYALTFRQSDPNTGIEIMDINNLYEAMYPENLTVDYIQLSEKGYSFYFKELNGSIACFDEESYNYNFELIYQNPSGVRTFLSQEMDQENKTITYSQNNDGKVYKTVTYTAVAHNIPIYVSELYLVNNADKANSETLTKLDVFGVKDTQHFMVSFFRLEDTAVGQGISEEWIASLGLRKYVETEVS